MGSLDSNFLATVRSVWTRLLGIGPYSSQDYECILMQGSGTFVVESVTSSAIPRNGKLPALVNRANGRRIAEARVHGIALDVLEGAENWKFTPDLVDEYMATAEEISHVAVVHCETTSGMSQNPSLQLDTRLGEHRRRCLISKLIQGRSD